MLQHLGPAQREWARGLGTYPQTDDYIEPMAEGVKQELKNYDFARTLQQRDQLLIKLLAAKKVLADPVALGSVSREECELRSSSIHHVVVVGGGIGGIVTATHLARRLRGTDRAGVILIDHNFAHA